MWWSLDRAPVGFAATFEIPNLTKRANLNMAVRVHELAREFQVPSKVVLEALHELGVYAKSASSRVEAPAVRKLRDHFGKPEQQRLIRKHAPKVDAPPSPRGRRPGNNPFSARYASLKQDPKESGSKVDRVSRALGLDPAEVELTPVRSKRSRQQTQKHRRDEWDEHFLTREDRAAWFAVGIDNPTTALACIQYGIQPEDLRLVVEGRAAWERLRANESVVIVSDMIKVEKRRLRESG